MPIVGGLDIHRKQIPFDYLDTVTEAAAERVGLLERHLERCRQLRAEHLGSLDDMHRAGLS